MRRRNRISAVAAIAKLSLLPAWRDETSLDLSTSTWLTTISSAELRPLCTKRQTRMSRCSPNIRCSIRVASCRFTSAPIGSPRLHSACLLSSTAPRYTPVPCLNCPLSIVEHLGEVCEWNSGRSQSRSRNAKAALHEWKLPRVYQTHASAIVMAVSSYYRPTVAISTYIDMRIHTVHTHTYTHRQKRMHRYILLPLCVPASCPYITVSQRRLLQFDLIWFPFAFASLSFCSNQSPFMKQIAIGYIYYTILYTRQAIQCIDLLVQCIMACFCLFGVLSY